MFLAAFQGKVSSDVTNLWRQDSRRPAYYRSDVEAVQREENNRVTAAYYVQVYYVFLSITSSQNHL
jgi:hypothetical protein